jgi:hypothetical protein
MAAILHGSPHATDDCDIAIYLDEVNRARLVLALAPLHPRPVRGKSEESYEWDEKSIVGPWTLLQTDAGRLDLVVRLAGVESFDGLFERAETTMFDGIPIRYAALDDLIKMKELADREKDQSSLLYLRALRSARDE